MEHRVILQGWRLIAAILLLALAYFVGARLGLLLAIPPGFATAVWPPAGIALAALLYGGKRLAWGILLGSLAANLYVASLNLGEGAWHGQALWLALGIAMGSTLQGVVAVYLIERVNGNHWSLLKLRAMLGVMMLGGPVACMISASNGNLMLWWMGLLSADELSNSWLTWWLGDSLGVFVFTPIILLWLLPKQTLLARTKGLLSLPLLLVFLIVVSLYGWMKQQEEQRLGQTLQLAVNTIQAQLSTQLARYNQALYSLRGLFVASEEVTHDEFERFARNLHVSIPGVQAVEWVPQVTHDERQEWERRARRAGFSGFSFTDLQGDGVAPASERPQYFPVYYLSPVAGNEEALGFDLFTNHNRREAIERALAYGTLVATDPLRLVQSDKPEWSFLLMLSVEASRQQLVLAVLRVSDMLAPIERSLAQRPIHLWLEDNASRIQFFSWPQQRSKPASQLLPMGGMYHQSLVFGDRTLNISAVLDPKYIAVQMRERIWPLLTFGFLGIGVLSVMILMLAERQHLSEQEALLRTRELRQERLFAERVLDSLPLMLVVKDMETGRYLRMNRTARHWLNLAPEQMEQHLHDRDLFGSGMEHVRELEQRSRDLQGEVLVSTERLALPRGERWLHSHRQWMRDGEQQQHMMVWLAEDVTQAQEQRQLMLTLVDALPMAVVIIDAYGRVLFANAKSLGLFGYAEPSMRQLFFETLLPPRYRDLYMSWRQLFFQQRKQGGEERFLEGLHAKGHSFPLELFAIPINWEGRDCALLLLQDRSEREHLQLSLRETEGRLRTLAENLPGVIWMAKPQLQQFIYVNQQFESIWGTPSQHLLSNPALFWQAVHPEDLPQVQEVLQQPQPERWHLEYRIYDAWGRMRHIRDVGRACVNEKGQLEYLIGIATDISADVKLKEELRRKDQWNELILANIGEGIYGLDSEGHCTFVNQVACTLLGYQEQELLGQPMHELIHYQHADGRPFPAQACPIYAAFTEGFKHVVRDDVFWCRDGRELKVNYVSTPIMQDDQCIGAVVVFSEAELDKGTV